MPAVKDESPSVDESGEGETTTGILRLVDKMSERGVDGGMLFILRRLAQHADSSGKALHRIGEQTTELNNRFDELNGTLLRLAANLEANQASVIRTADEHAKLVGRVERIRARVKSFTSEEGNHNTPNLIAVATPMQAIPVQAQPSPEGKSPKLSRSDLPNALDEVVKRRVGAAVLIAIGAISGAIAAGIGTALVSSFLSHWH
jgi:hypothetical protein